MLTNCQKLNYYIKIAWEYKILNVLKKVYSEIYDFDEEFKSER